MRYEKLKQLSKALEIGLVKAKRHSELPLTIYCNNRWCKLKDMWQKFDGVALDCRGLILDDDGNVIARPYKKFFRLDENVGPLTIKREDLKSNPVRHISEKIDGTFVIVYFYQGKWRAATKLSFDSKQAKFAQAILDECSKGIDLSDEVQQSYTHYTFCCEAVYPEDMKIIDYGGAKRLFLHGVLHKEGLEFLPEAMDEVLECTAESFLNGKAFSLIGNNFEKNKTLESIYNIDNIEGCVMILEDGRRVKFKTEYYRTFQGRLLDC